MPRKIEVEIVGDSRSLERAFKRSEKSATKFQATMRGVGSSVRSGLLTIGAAVGVGVGFEALVEGIQHSVKAASDLHREMSKTRVVFGASARAIDSWAKTTADAFGITEEEALRGASNFGLLFNQLGKGKDVSASISKRFVELAGDLSSFFRIDPSVVLDKLRAGLYGQARGLKQYGINLTAARVQAEAYRAGIARVGSKLTEAQKVQARVNIILHDAAPAFGNAARNANSWEQVQKRLKATLDDLSAAIGSKLLPYFRRFATRFENWLSNTKNQKTVVDDMTTSITLLGNAAEGAAVGFQQLHDAAKAMDELPFGKALKWAASTAVPVQLQRGIEFLKHGAPGARPPWWAPPPPPMAQQSFVPASWYKQHGFPVPKPQKSKVPDSWFVEHGFKPPSERGPVAGAFTGPRRPDLAARAAQRNTWFDNMIARQLNRVQDLSLRKQAARLAQIAQEVRARLAGTKDATRRLTLEDKLLDITRQQKDVQSQITDEIKKANQLLKDRADAIKQAVLDRLDRQRTRVENQRALKDANEALRIARQLGGPKGIQAARRQRQDVLFDILRARAEAAPARLTRGGVFSLGNVITINIHGVTDPDKVAKAVVAAIKRNERRKTTQTRGAHAGAGA